MRNTASSPTVTYCSFTANDAGGGPGPGGGMANRSNSNPTVTHCSFVGNKAGNGGGMYNAFSNPLVTHCVFRGNDASVGGGMANATGSPIVTQCSFIQNSAGAGGGMCNSFDSAPTVTHCTFQGNTALLGGGMDFRFVPGSPVTLIADCSFIGNSATVSGGGLSFRFANLAITRCLISENSAPEGGGLFGDQSAVSLAMSAICRNTPDQISGGFTDNGGNAISDDHCVPIPQASPDDADGDGVPDACDACPDSDLSETVFINQCESGVSNQTLDHGCTMADLIADCAQSDANHGAFTSCVTGLARGWIRSDLITGAGAGRIIQCAASSPTD